MRKRAEFRRRDSLPRISIVVPSLNAEKTIDRTLRSIKRQRYPNLQVICVDGKSSDRTLAIIRRYRSMIGKIISGKDKNIANALNKGFRFADGDIFCFLNADDAFTPGTLHAIAKVFSAEPETDVVTGGCRRVFADGSKLVTQVPRDFLQALSMRNGIEQPSTFWRASIHRKLKKFDESYYLALDWEWWNRLHRRGARFKTISRILSVYYFSNDNLTSRSGSKSIQEIYRITKTYGPFGGRIADVHKFLYRVFDLRGYYDVPFHELSKPKQLVFGFTLKVLCSLFGREPIYYYNWNWVSKQVRGVVWYK